jgi:cytochrome c-type biogenesis protein CcmE
MKFAIGDFVGQEDVAAGSATLAVAYTGVVPDMFAEGRDVIIEGRYADGVLRAQTIMTSCPSKYEPEAPGAEGGDGRRAAAN